MPPPTLPHPDILRPTEIHDFSDLIPGHARGAQFVLAVALLVGIVVLGEFLVLPAGEATAALLRD